MPDNRQNQSNAASISSNGPVDSVDEDLRKMKIENKEVFEEEREEEGEQSNKYPDRPGEPNCLYYMKTGLCGYGSNCRFNHPPLTAKTTQDRSELPQREGQTECGYFIKTGTCKYGSTCKYHHPLDRHQAGQVQLNTLGLPIRQEEKSCPYYMRNYTCKFGPACKFNHPEFPSALPVSASATAGTMGSFWPSNVVPYDSTFQAWSVTKSLCMGSLRAPFPPTYVPLGFPSLQGPVVAQGWNGYMSNYGGTVSLLVLRKGGILFRAIEGNLNAISASNLMATNMAYNPNNQGEVATNGQLDMWTMSIPQLPERPGQPQCRYFMSTGTCRYGSNCKFHHPKERPAQLAMNVLGPHGLPLRPGEDICGDYRSYGICKYGPTCKFNHPFGYVGGWYFGMTPQPMENNFPISNHRNQTIANSSDSPQSKSSKITDWIQKPENVEDTDPQNADVKVVEDSNEPGDHKPDAAPATSDELH